MAQVGAFLMVTHFRVCLTLHKPLMSLAMVRLTFLAPMEMF
jgi:hypothetical protein